MNKLAIENLIEVLQSDRRTRFDMRTWSCGSAACIAGHAVIYLNKDGTKKSAFRRWWERKKWWKSEYSIAIEMSAKTILGLDYKKTRELFTPTAGQLRLEYEEITSDHAILVLRHILATGKVDWSVIQ